MKNIVSLDIEEETYVYFYVKTQLQNGFITLTLEPTSLNLKFKISVLIYKNVQDLSPSIPLISFYPVHFDMFHLVPVTPTSILIFKNANKAPTLRPLHCCPY